MAQDYARQRDRLTTREGRPRAATRTPPPATSHWNWYIAGVLSGLFAVFIGYIGIVNLGDDTPNDTNTVQVVVAEEDIPIFSFYNELANARVDVNSTAAPGVITTPATATTPAEPGTDAATANLTPTDNREYLLQAGSFQDRQDAENRRAKIILLNMNATVAPGLVAGRTWQRVQVGPFIGRQSAEQARALLSENNIDSIPLIVR